MPIFKYLHLLTMFSAVGTVIGTEVLLHRVARWGDVRAIRAAFLLAKPMNLIAPVLFLLGVAFGFIDAITRGFDLFAPWLLIAYVLFVAMFVLGGAVQGRWIERIVAAAASSEGASPTADLQRVIHDRRAAVVDVRQLAALGGHHLHDGREALQLSQGRHCHVRLLEGGRGE